MFVWTHCMMNAHWKVITTSEQIEFAYQLAWNAVCTLWFASLFCLSAFKIRNLMEILLQSENIIWASEDCRYRGRGERTRAANSKIHYNHGIFEGGKGAHTITKSTLWFIRLESRAPTFMALAFWICIYSLCLLFPLSLSLCSSLGMDKCLLLIPH